MLHTLQDAYDYPVDLEFTANFSDPDHYKINLVQCRPLQVTSECRNVELPKSVSPDDRVLEARGAGSSGRSAGRSSSGRGSGSSPVDRRRDVDQPVDLDPIGSGR